MIGELSNHLWQSTVFALAAGLLAASLRGNRARVRYWLWLAASVKFLVPFSLLISLGSYVRWAQSASESMTASAASLAIAQITRPFSDVSSSATAVPTLADWSLLVIIGVWAAGFIAIALTRLKGWRQIRSAVSRSVPLTHPSVAIEPPVEIRSALGLLEPGVVGLWRPVLLMPAGVDIYLTPPQLKAIVAHELHHVRRRDNLTAAIHMIVEAIFWFHPVVWWIGARLIGERERACDEHVLRVVPEPEAYAEGILNICRLYVESPLACVPGVTGSDVKKRIEDIMSNRIGIELTGARKAALVAAATVALAAPIVVGMVTAPLRAQSAARVTTGASQPRLSDPSALIQTKEVVLKYALFQMREAIDRYHTDHAHYPSSLESLTSEGYLTQIPTDPFTNRVDSWQTFVSMSDPERPATDSPGIQDVRSGSDAAALDGTSYSAW